MTQEENLPLENTPTDAATDTARAFAPETLSIDRVLGVKLPVSVLIGGADLPVRNVLQLQTGSSVELDREAATEFELIVDGAVVATGELIQTRGNFGIRIGRIISRSERLTLCPRGPAVD